MGGPRVHGPAALLADAFHRLPIECLEEQAEPSLELLAPLRHHRWRTDHDDVLHASAEEQFAGDEAGLDRLAEADVVGDEEVDAWEQEGLAERLKLVGIEPDAGTEGRLKEPRIGGSDTVPAKRADEGAEKPRVIKPLGADLLPDLSVEDFGVELEIPDHLQGVALGVVVDAGEGHLRAVGRRLDRLDEPRAGAAADDLAGGRESGVRMCSGRG